MKRLANALLALCLTLPLAACDTPGGDVIEDCVGTFSGPVEGPRTGAVGLEVLDAGTLIVTFVIDDMPEEFPFADRYGSQGSGVPVNVNGGEGTFSSSDSMAGQGGMLTGTIRLSDCRSTGTWNDGTDEMSWRAVFH